MSQKGLRVQQWEGIGLDPALPIRLTSDTKDEGREEETEGNEWRRRRQRKGRRCEEGRRRERRGTRGTGRRQRRLDSGTSIDCGSPWLLWICYGAWEP